MQSKIDASDLPPYNEARPGPGIWILLSEWFLPATSASPRPARNGHRRVRLPALWVDNAARQEQVFVHRDYHSRNLLVGAPGAPGILDFQDAVRGPLTYDLVSLLRDCYIAWPEERVYAWVEDYRQRLVAAGLTRVDAAAFRRGLST
jgi:aminoglycoside/choline kinase family phosphotransferase